MKLLYMHIHEKWSYTLMAINFNVHFYRKTRKVMLMGIKDNLINEVSSKKVVLSNLMQ